MLGHYEEELVKTKAEAINQFKEKLKEKMYRIWVPDFTLAEYNELSPLTSHDEMCNTENCECRKIISDFLDKTAQEILGK